VLNFYLQVIKVFKNPEMESKFEYGTLAMCPPFKNKPIKVGTMKYKLKTILKIFK
jgi:hypothetical protein